MKVYNLFYGGCRFQLIAYMGEFGQINEIVSDAVRNSSYITVLISSGVFILYTLVIKVVDLFKAKNRSKPLIEMAAAIKQVSENVVKLNNVLDRTFKSAEAKEIQNIKNIITLSFDSWKFDIIYYCGDIITHNNIQINEQAIKQSLHKYINTEYYKLYSLLSAYEINDINVSTKIKDEWIEELTKECINIIFNGQEKDIRIVQLANKIQIIVNNYSVYLMNKVFNH